MPNLFAIKAVILLCFATHLVNSLDFSAIGFEFELINVELRMRQGKFKDPSEAAALKGKLISQYTNQQWLPLAVNVFNLTADELAGSENAVSFEFIADARLLPLSDPNLAAKGEELSVFITERWDPLAAANRDTKYSILGSDVKDWRIATVNDKLRTEREPHATKDILSNAHITAATNLNGIQRLFRWGQRGQESVLRPKELVHCAGWNRDVYVTVDYFKRINSGIPESELNDSVLGFLSLMMSMAKTADKLDGPKGVDPKLRFYIMPRTSWLKLYTLAAIPRISGSNTLYELARSLSCYQWEGDTLIFDSDYCNIWSRKPEKEFEKRGWVVMIPKERARQLKDQGSPLAELISRNPFGNQRKVTLTVRKWIEGFQAGIDWLRLYDTLFNSQIGAFGDAMEPLFRGSGLAPIFEFRTPYTLGMNRFADYMYMGAAEIKLLQRP